ncbi:hypothetical protein Cgig2_030602 [Carnegiea gigantea]|uniref:FAT domain-containing protein n=1 Tax=Carnegiea gigantea TaxID=171969 RepID=A0A9Q1JJ18_9CARY|nr:hypothetical protein Cgig2_030602 [Carnegiea gigantea]
MKPFMPLQIKITGKSQASLRIIKVEYAVELHFEADTTAYEFGRTFCGVQESPASDLGLQGLYTPASFAIFIDSAKGATFIMKGSMFSQAAASLHEFKSMCMELGGQNTSLYWLGRLEEAKLLRAQGQQLMAINLGKYIAEQILSNEESSDVHRLVGKWLAETRTSNSRTILEKYLKHAVLSAEQHKSLSRKSLDRKCQTHFHLAHYADALFRNHEERLNSSEWQAAMRLRKHKKMELEALIKRLRSSTKGEKADYSLKIQELQKQLAMDTEEAEKLQDDRDNFLNLALEGYKRCLVIGDKYDVRVVFRLISLWFSLSSRQNVISVMLNTVKEVQSYKFIPLVYQIASRLGSMKDVEGSHTFQFALASLLKKLAIEHPYHTIFQLLALANGDRIKDKQRSRNSFVVDIDKKLAAEKLLEELSAYHGAIIRQMKQMVEIYIRLAELETKREDMNRRISLPRDIRSVRELELTRDLKLGRSAREIGVNPVSPGNDRDNRDNTRHGRKNPRNRSDAWRWTDGHGGSRENGGGVDEDEVKECGEFVGSEGEGKEAGEGEAKLKRRIVGDEGEGQAKECGRRRRRPSEGG